MRFTRFIFFFVVLISVSALSAFAQTAVFSDPNAEYTFVVPDAEWKMTVKPSVLSPNVEYVFKDRQDGHLEVRRLQYKSGDLLSDVIRGEEDKLQFLPGYVAGKEEQFAGNLKGTVFNYEFVARGRNMSGRFYFLKSGAADIYVLRFTGERDKLRTIRNYTDSIARTFDLKKGK